LDYGKKPKLFFMDYFNRFYYFDSLVCVENDMINIKLKDIENIFKIALSLFGVYLFFQIVRKMMGGSWSTEDIILGLLVFVVGSIFTIAIMLAQLKSDHNHLKNQFTSLVGDFKELSSSVKSLSDSFHSLSENLKKYAKNKV
jgi:multisubunit Na+/H+ antiporter MnhG subunit